MSLKHALFVTLLFSIVFTSFSQYRKNTGGDYNRIGISGGLAFFDINTSNFTTESATGFSGGLTTRGSFRNNFDLIYGVGFTSLNVGILARAPLSATKQILDFNIIAANINFQGSYNIIKHHLSIEFGPVLVVNGKLKSNEQFDSYIIDGYVTTTAKDLQNVNTINANGLIGLTAGVDRFRLTANYQYGFTNILGGLNDQGLETTDFKGNTSTITIMGIVYL